MTYLPTKPPGTAPNAGPLSDADLLPLSQAGVTRRATLATLRSFVLAGATGSTGATGGTTGSTGSTSGGVAPAGRLGYPASTPVVRNMATTPAAVTVPAAPSRSLPAFTQASGESARGKVIDKNNYTTDSITLADGTKIGLVASANRPAGFFTLTKNGSIINNSRLDLIFGVKNSPITFDDAVQLVYHGTDDTSHNVYVMNDHGLGAQTWFKLEGNGPDLDTEGDDPRVSALVADAVAPVGDPPYGLGTHPASVGDEPRFGTWIADFNRSVGRPAYVNCFLSYDPDFTGWGGEAGTAAYKLSQSDLGKYCTPVLGMPMARNSNFGQGSNNVDLNNFINGTYDPYVTAAVKAYLQYFDRLDVRPGYEGNGTFMPWFWGGQNGETVTGPLWLAAFRHIYTLCKAAAVSASTDAGKTKTCLVTWNPCHQNNNAGSSPRDMYPGDDYNDYQGLDTYSPNYAQDNTNWSGDGQVYSSDKPTWSVQKYKNPLNRIKFWDYPGICSTPPTSWVVQHYVRASLT